MKKEYRLFVSVMILFCTAISVSCAEKENSQSLGNPADYFPMDTGREWTYKIKIGEVEPLIYKEMAWPMGGMKVTYSTRGRFLPLVSEKSPPDTFILKMKVKGSAKEQGPLQYPIGVELETQKDELGIFYEHKKIFWAVIPEKFMVNQIVTYPSTAIGAPTGSWGMGASGEGNSLRIIFFIGNPGTNIGLVGKTGDQPTDALEFIGTDDNVPQYKGKTCLHFRRIVKSSEKVSFSGFSEDMWFMKNKGLVRLEQKIAGKVSMTWTLE